MLYKTMAIYGRTMKHYEPGVHATIKNQVLLMQRCRDNAAYDFLHVVTVLPPDFTEFVAFDF